MQEPLSFGVRVPFTEMLGFRLVVFEGGRSRFEFEPKAEHLNSFGVAHGGAVMTLLDVSMAGAARSVQPGFGVVTIEMKTSFMRPSSGPLVCEGRLLHRTASLAFVEATVLDAQEQACAHATGTFKYVRRRAPATPDANAGTEGAISTD